MELKLIPLANDCPQCLNHRKALAMATRRPSNRGDGYSVLSVSGGNYYQIEDSLSRDEAVGYAKGAQNYYDNSRGAREFIVVCGNFVCYPEDRYGEMLEDIKC
jgi:hypothetical protein